MLDWQASASRGVLRTWDGRFVITQRTDGGYTLADRTEQNFVRTRRLVTAQAVANLRAGHRVVLHQTDTTLR